MYASLTVTFGTGVVGATMFFQLACVVLLGTAASDPGSWYNDLFWWLPARNVCYEEYGCFSTAHPFSNTEGHLPQSPEIISPSILLYTRSNREQPANITQVVGPNFSSQKEIKIIIHGYFNTISERWVVQMKNALLDQGDVNVFVLNWERGAGSLIYLQSVANSRLVAAITSKYIKNLIENHNVNASSIHLIGFSLGAHLAGYIGTAVPGIGRITGLDPAGPSFEGRPDSTRLDKSDAKHVDVIHSDGDKLFSADFLPGFGTFQRMGDVDYYLNGGADQPGCATNVNDHLMEILRGEFHYKRNIGCSHMRALHVFTESLNSNCSFKSCPCSVENLRSDDCKTCNAEVANYLGTNIHWEKAGIFYTKTRESYPFCLQ